MSSCNNCGDFKIYDDCCDKKEPTIITKKGIENNQAVLVTIDYEEEPFNGLVLTGGEFSGSVDPSVNLVNVPTGAIFSLVLDISGASTSGSNIEINGTSLGGSISIEKENNLIVVGKNSQVSRLI